ncbi:MAG: hypothetical protein V4591_10370 [Bdellovibrionota bacterium]
MVVAAIQTANIQAATQNDVSHHAGDGGMGLENLVDPASSHDVSTFHASLQQSILQNSPTSAGANSTFSANALTEVVSHIVDSIQGDRSKIASLSSNLSEMSAQDALELQETTESLSLSVQFLSKTVTMATKAIDTIVHMQ